MLEKMAFGELEGWRVYAALEPFGPLQDDLRAVIPAVTLANVNRDKHKKPDAFQPKDFIVRPEFAEINALLMRRLERNPALALPAADDGIPGSKSAGDLMRTMEAFGLVMKGSKDNRKKLPNYGGSHERAQVVRDRG